MQIKKLLKNDDDAVSPVIGVILMVAITVILAAVIGAFVLNLGGSQASAPQASYQCGGSNGTDLVHDGGDELQNSTLSYSGTNDSASFNDGVEPYTAGETIVNGFEDGELIWTNPNSDDTNILADRDCT